MPTQYGIIIRDGINYSHDTAESISFSGNGITSTNVQDAINELNNKIPTVPTNISAFNNDSGYITGITKTMVTNALGYTPPTTNTTYSAGTGIGLSGTSFYLPIPRVAESCNALPSAASLRFREYTAGSNYNLPTNAWYQILEIRSSDTNYGTQLALGMTTTAAYYRNYSGAKWSGWYSLINTNTTYSGSSTVTLSGTTFSLTKANVTTALGYTPPNGSINNATLTIQRNGSNVATFTSNASSNVTANISVPTNTNQLTNGAGYITSSGSISGYAGYLRTGSNSFCYKDSKGITTLNGNNGAVEIRSTDVWHFTVQADGNLVMYQNSTAKWNSGTSSRRFKHNIQDMTEERAKKILDIRPVTFDWNDGEPVTTQKEDNAGVIAEEVSQVIPDLVVFEELFDEDGKVTGTVERRVEYERFTPYLIKLCQMQQKEIDDLKERINKLENK